MNKVRINNFRIRNIEPFEHLDYIIKNTTPTQRLKWLEQAWYLWREIRKNLPKRIIKLQDKFRRGDI